MPVSLEEMNGPDLLNIAYEAIGITPEYLARKAKKELNAKETKIVKVKGALTDDVFPRTKSGKLKTGYRVIGTSGVIETFKVGDETEREAGDGDTVIAIDMIDWSTRQRARISVEQHLGFAKAQQHEHTGTVSVIPQIEQKDREMILNLGNQVVDAILEQHRRDIKSGG